MSSKTLYRLSGFALLFGSLLVVLFAIMQFLVFDGGTSDRYTSPLWQPILLLIVLGLLLIVAGLPGMYARQAERAAWLGLVGCALTGFAVLLFGALSALYALVIPLLDTHTQLLLTGYSNLTANGGRIPPLLALQFVAVLLLSVGTFLLGLATTRAGVLPHVAGVAFIVAGPAALTMLAGPFLGVPVLGDLLWPLMVIGILTAFVVFFLGLVGCGFALLSLQKVEATSPQPMATKAQG
ncbi:MAG: hypothetical protein NVS4B11_36660 [Ktedonobacteraceae bacterium]